MKAIVNVFLKEGVLDPQGKAAHHPLESLNYNILKDVRIGKQIILQLDT
jgi:phosphoribosylformylglycinamidine synthase